MKKNLLTIASIALVAGAITLTGCKKEDTTAPEVTAPADDIISLQEPYTQLEGTATDDKDGELTVTYSGTVDNNKTGTYVITFTATDAAGNVGTAEQTITVVNDADYLTGNYNGQETDVNGPYTYVGNTDATKVVTITASTTVNNRVTINRLGDFSNNAVYMNVTGTSITIPSQTVANVGSGSNSCDVHSRQSDGTGSISGTTISLTYNDAKVAPCSGTRTGVTATFTKK